VDVPELGDVDTAAPAGSGSEDDEAGPDRPNQPSLNEIARRMDAPTAGEPTGDGTPTVVEPVGGPER
jgi:hypothetical protein